MQILLFYTEDCNTLIISLKNKRHLKYFFSVYILGRKSIMLSIITRDYFWIKRFYILFTYLFSIQFEFLIISNY